MADLIDLGEFGDDFRTDPLFPRLLQVRTVCCVNYVVPNRSPRSRLN